MLEVGRLWRRVRAIFRRQTLDADMREEFGIHLEMEVEHLMATRGLTRDEAHRSAARAFGGLSRFEELSRDVRGVRPLEDFARDIRYSVRLLTRSRVFAVVAILTLALGIGAMTAIFGVLNGVVLQPLPYPDSHRLVAVHHTAADRAAEVRGISSILYHRYRERGTAIEELGVYRESALNLAGEEGAERIQVAAASPELFRILGVQPALGRLYGADDWTGSTMDLTWTMPVLLAYDFWQTRFGGDPGVLGRVISINDSPREVVGVLPAGFAFPRPETQVWRMDVPPDATGSAVVVSGNYRGVGRLRAGASAAEAAREYAGILASFMAEYPEAATGGAPELPVVQPLKDAVLGDTRNLLWILFGSVVILLLVACANVANLFAVRAENRGGEVAIRTALGAGRFRLARLFLTESLLVSLAAAVLGLVLAYWAVRLVVRLAPSQLPRLDAAGLDARTVGLAMALAVFVSLVLGVLSVLRHIRPGSFPSGLRSGRGSVGAPRRRTRVIGTLIGAQVALTLALLAGSALMLRSYHAIMTVDRGFVRADVLTVEIGVPFRMAERHQQLYADVSDRMRAIPAVASVGGVSVLPLAGGGAEHPIRPVYDGLSQAQTTQPAAFRFVLPGYFETMRTPVIEGIGFTPGQAAEPPYPVVVSEALARRLFPGETAMGRRLERLDARGDPIWMFDFETRTRVPVPPYTIAGVVGNMHDDALQAHDGETLYIPVISPRVEQSIMPLEMGFVLRTRVPPAHVASAARRAVHDVDPALSVVRVRTMNEIVASATSRERFLAVLLLGAATVSLLLGAVGIYGIAAYTVRRRTSEIGVRVALGARPMDVAWMVLRQTLSVVVLGAAAGLVLAMAATRVLRTVLYQVSPTDPAVLLGVAGLIIAAAAAASLGPAWRAARANPTSALREE